MNLVIVESPTKAKTISKFLGKNFNITSSYGHVRDLPKSEIGIDLDNNFEPRYVIPTKSRKKISELKKQAAKAHKIIIATDEDREGEAIAWHLTQALGINEDLVERIVFHEITKEALMEALAEPRRIDQKLVDAQQARRILDRLVGYKLSPFLWKKVARGLSAGRVQSVAVRLIIEREREINEFKPEEYWKIAAQLKTKNNESLVAFLNKIDGKKLDKFTINNEKKAKQIIDDLANSKYHVNQVSQRQTKKNPPRPFITSTLQQTANRWLGFSAKQTMVIAQQLYEGIKIASEDQTGLITYMRTDSYNLSSKFLKDSQEYLKKTLGGEYSLKSPRYFKAKAKGAQEAHEAIRPTGVWREPNKIKNSLSNNQHKLYQLIWQRALASQMPEALINATNIDVDAPGQKTEENASAYQFRASGQIIKFDGYLKIYPEKSKEINLPPVKEGDKLELEKLDPIQSFTKPPARYSDAGLIKILEGYGIGRPSTYAPTIATIETRNYVKRDDNKRLMPTEIAFTVNDLLVDHFSNIVDYEFTAQMEDRLDDIANGKTKWQPIIKDFWQPFNSNLEKKYAELDKNDILPDKKSEEVCDKCGSAMVIKTGRYGPFLACSGFPECKNIKNINNGRGEGKEKTEEMKKMEEEHKEEVCNKCGSAMVIKTGRYGPFLACSGFPECKNIKNINSKNDSTGVACPECNKGEIIKKRSRRGVFYACNQYPECRNAYPGKPTAEKCPECQNFLIELQNNTNSCSDKSCNFKK